MDLVWANSNNEKLIKKSEKIFTSHLTKSMNFASWSSDEKIFKTLQNGLSNLQGIDTDNDSWEYAE